MPAVLEWKGVKWRDAREKMLEVVGEKVSISLKGLLSNLLPEDGPPQWKGGPSFLILKPEEDVEALLYAPYGDGRERVPMLEVDYGRGEGHVLIYSLRDLGADLDTFHQLVRALQDMLKEVAPEKEMADAVGKWR